VLPSGRRLAIDYGDVRIGIALSDATGLIATPYKTLINGPDRFLSAIEEIFQIVMAEDIRVIYIGWPLHLSGAEGISSEKVRAFAKSLEKRLPTSIPIRALDERFSTKSVHDEARLSGKKVSRANIDQLAAAAILEFALGAEKVREDLAGHEF
jgi:putative holliday junction resolvase